MRITDIHVEGFGVWSDLKLSGISPKLTVFYGANEAGKTTLMQFLRAVPYGMSPTRRRYLPPVNGGRPGGSLALWSDQEQLTVTRIADRGDDDLGLVTIIDGEGQSSGDRLLRDALAGVDERTYENIFALGLSEIQELGTLSDSQAAEWLYRLTSGLDRVCLYDVIQGIRQTRQTLISTSTEARIPQLVTRHEDLLHKVEQQSQQGRRWAQLSVRIEEIDAQIAAQEELVREREHQARTIEIAVGLKENWRKRAKLRMQLEELNHSIQLPTDAGERLDQLNQKLESHQREADMLEGQRRQLREEKERLGINELLVENAPRIDALGEQREWLQSLERQIGDLGIESKELESRLARERNRLATALGAKGDKLPEINTAELENLRPALDAMQAAQRKIDQATRDLDSLTENERSLKVKIDSAIVGGQQHGLPMDLQEASDLVARLRRRLQVEQRLDQTRSHEVELENQSHDLLDEQIMPLWGFGWSLAAVVVGSLLMGTWLIVPGSPLGSAGGGLAFMGLVTSIFAFAFKFFAEQGAADKLDACQRQMEALARQAEEIQQEKKKLDAELPLTDGSVVLRLQAAERHLAELESVLPFEAQRKRAGHEVSTAESRVTQAKAEMEKALVGWKNKLNGMGLCDKLDPQQFLSYTERFTALEDLENRVKLRLEEIAVRQREHATLTRRIRDVAVEVDCVLYADPPAGQEQATAADEEEEVREVAPILDQLEHLVEQRRRQLSDIKRREELFERASELKAQEAQHRRVMAGIRRRREAIFQAADCEDEPAYRRLIQEQELERKLQQQCESISREILAAIGSHGTEETYADLLSPEAVATLSDRWAALTAEVDRLKAELKTYIDDRGALRQQQRELAQDTTLAELQLELSCVEKQLADAQQSWREHATLSRVLERVRHHYEAHRQPETLAEASRHMARLTGGEYRRIWTPIADDVLFVENSVGDSLTIDRLSRGTREQLFLSIRLAVVANYAKRGVQLPMVLDDVLVNFDAVRSQRAAEVLGEFADGGHQLMIFTCHEHIWQMFQAVGADCRRLPNRFGEVIEEEPDEEVMLPDPEPQEDEPAPVKKPKRKRRVIVEEVISPEPVDFYDYPFEERIEEEVVTPARRVPTDISDLTPEFPTTGNEAAYHWQSQPFQWQDQDDWHGGENGQSTDDQLLAYIVSGDDRRNLNDSQRGHRAG